MFFQFSTTHHFFSFNCIILDRPKGKAVRNISAHTKRAPLAIRTLSPRVVSWFVAVFLRQPFQKGGFVTVLPRRPFCRISSRLATGHRLSRSGGYARSLGSFTIIVGFKTCAGNFAQRTRIFLIDKRKKRKTPHDKHGTPSQPYSSDATHAAPFLFHRLLTRIVRDLHLHRRNFPHSRTYGVQTALAPPLATGCELLSASRGSRGGVTGHPHPPVSFATPSANLFHRG